MGVNLVEHVDDLVAVRHALVSVSDKQGLDWLIPELVQKCPGLIVYSTGGTYQKIETILGEQAKGTLIQVSSYTGQPETQGGLVKTLDFKIYLGLLTETYNASHQADLSRTGAVPIDLVVVNLYPFEATVARDSVAVEEARANIDIGGPCMIRAAAKNYLRVAVVVDPADYLPLVESFGRQDGRTSLKQRFQLARKAFLHTARYDQAISDYLSRVSVDMVSRCYTTRQR